MRYKDIFVKNLADMKPRQLAEFLERMVESGNCCRCEYYNFQNDECCKEDAGKGCVDGVTKWLKRKFKNDRKKKT